MTQRGALGLLCVYGENSSSEDEVPYGRVSVKRCHKDSDEDETPPQKVLRPHLRFSLPDIIKVNREQYVDDPSLHEGRIRSFPHERGNWATYIYVGYDSNDDIEFTIDKLCTKLNHFNFKSIDNLHISLTKVLILKHHWIDSFVDTFKENIARIKRFILMFDNLNVYCNEERTRTFIGLEIKTGYDSLLNLVATFNRCLGDFNLPPFYKNPSFHMSLAWCTGDTEEAVKSILPELNEEFMEMKSRFDEVTSYILVDKLYCKIGNKLYTFTVS